LSGDRRSSDTRIAGDDESRQENVACGYASKTDASSYVR
jgi:hypothetical protein